MAAETYSTADVGKHKDEQNGYWLIVETDVYDVTSKKDHHLTDISLST